MAPQRDVTRYRALSAIATTSQIVRDADLPRDIVLLFFFLLFSF